MNGMQDGMKAMKNKFFEMYFSPTGGTRRVSKILADGLSGGLNLEPAAVDLFAAVREGGALPEFAAGDVCLISVPSFAGRVPLPAAEKLAEMKGNGALAILNVVYGNRAIDDTLLELADVLEEAGFTCAAAMETVAEHSIFRQFGAGRPDRDDEAELSAFAKETARILKNGNFSGSLKVPGNFPYRERKPGSMIPVGGENCTGCGLCAAKCPAHAIPAEDLKAVNRDACMGCMACVSVCPAGARDIPAEIRQQFLPHMTSVCSGRKENRLYIEREV